MMMMASCRGGCEAYTQLNDNYWLVDRSDERVTLVNIVPTTIYNEYESDDIKIVIRKMSNYNICVKYFL